MMVAYTIITNFHAESVFLKNNRMPREIITFLFLFICMNINLIIF